MKTWKKSPVQSLWALDAGKEYLRPVWMRMKAALSERMWALMRAALPARRGEIIRRIRSGELVEMAFRTGDVPPGSVVLVSPDVAREEFNRFLDMAVSWGGVVEIYGADDRIVKDGTVRRPTIRRMSRSSMIRSLWLDAYHKPSWFVRRKWSLRVDDADLHDFRKFFAQCYDDLFENPRSRVSQIEAAETAAYLEAELRERCNWPRVGPIYQALLEELVSSKSASSEAVSFSRCQCCGRLFQLHREHQAYCSRRECRLTQERAQKYHRYWNHPEYRRARKAWRKRKARRTRVGRKKRRSLAAPRTE